MHARADIATRPQSPAGGVVAEIRSIEGDSYLSLTQWEADDFGVKAAIGVRDGEFAGAYDRVWFFRDKFATFVQARAEFTVAHEGEARLESMSPGEAIVSIRRLDAARHILAEVQVSRWHYVRGRLFRHLVSVMFEVDPSHRPEAVRSLAAVIAEGKPS